QMTTAMQVVPMAVVIVAYSLVAREGADGAWPEHRRLIVQTMLYAAVAAAVAYALAPTVVPLLAGRGFAPAVPRFRIPAFSISGLREPLVQTQVLPYLRELAKGGERMSLLTFEPRPWPDAMAAEWRVRLRADGIAWHRLPYHKRPSLPATLYDIARGALRAAAI